MMIVAISISEGYFAKAIINKMTNMCPPGPPLDIFWFNEYSYNFELGRREKEKNPESSFQCKHHETCV